jgi:hypothetical protein
MSNQTAPTDLRVSPIPASAVTSVKRAHAPEQAVGLSWKATRAEIAVVVVVDPRRRAADAVERQAARGRDVGEMTAVAVVAIEPRGCAGDEPDVEIQMAVRVEITPGGRARLDVVGQADGGGHVLEASMILAIQAIGTAAKTDELVEVAVVVEVGPRVAAGHREELGLDQLETGGGGRHKPEECRGRQDHS